jgi:hypothetical protein
MDIKAELEKFEKSVAVNKSILEKYRAMLDVKGVTVHFIPDMQKDGSIVVSTVSFTDDGKSAQSVGMVDVAAMFFYEAYREFLPKIFARALERADGAVAERARALKAELEQKRSALESEIAAVDSALAPYAPAKKAAGGKR